MVQDMKVTRLSFLLSPALQISRGPSAGIGFRHAAWNKTTGKGESESKSEVGS